MKYIDADKLIKLVNNYRDGAKAALNPIDGDADYYKGKIDACENIQELIAPLQQEQPSLPSDLDEAAEEYSRKKAVKYYGNTFYAFKAGAEWMAGQGETHETEIVSRINARGLLPAVTCLVDNSYKEGDKVVVQIRKK